MEENAPLWYNLEKYPAPWWAEYRIQNPENGMVYDVFGAKIIGATLSVDRKTGVMNINFEARDDVDQPYLAPVSSTAFKTEDKSKLIISISDLEKLRDKKRADWLRDEGWW